MKDDEDVDLWMRAVWMKSRRKRRTRRKSRKKRREDDLCHGQSQSRRSVAGCAAEEMAEEDEEGMAEGDAKWEWREERRARQNELWRKREEPGILKY